ncbi:GGDEF domain-containing protein [Mangrovicella endophytica]|uniref:GGDEF domain-containing protein n=1 Tax=Mangrovicella endophytica TaxID=2066697 RepID=UPI000C9DDA87|nr:sensor domain-containing diguanylate cyclase [Mangrovicella endophytica]
MRFGSVDRGYDAAAREPLFALSPIPLWLEDYSGVKALIDGWRADGVTDIRAFLAEDLSRVAASSQAIRILAVNQKVLDLFGARDLDDLRANVGEIFRNDMLLSHLEEVAQLFEGGTEFASLAANYTLTGKRLDVQLKARILPGHEDDWSCVLLSTEDVTEREQARRRAAESEEYARGLFDHSPVSLWVEDFSAVRELIEGVRDSGVSDFRVFVDVHPEFVQRCLSEIRVIDVNRHTLELFCAPSREALTDQLDSIFRDAMEQHFKEQLIDLWNGKLFQQREVVNYSLKGDELHVHMQFSVFPGHEHDWSLVQVALTDITARKRAEAYLEFLGKHDALTKLYNRSFFIDELNRLERKRATSVTIIVADLNGLKTVNDTLGHAAGDGLLRRAGEVLQKAVARPSCAARIGGDEFVILMPMASEVEGAAMMETLENLVEINNQFYSSERLSFALGMATAQAGERLEDVVKLADERMYAAKRALYETGAVPERRQPGH